MSFKKKIESYHPNYFMHVLLIIINEGLNFSFLCPKFNFLFYEFYYLLSHYFSLNE